MKVHRFVALLGAMILTTGVAANAFAAPAAAGAIGGPDVAWSTTTGGDNDCWERSGDNAISSTDRSGKDECKPLIKIVKTADPETLPVGGGEVTYTYVVSNEGNVPVKNVAVSDDKCSIVKGGHDGDLKPGKSWTYTCTTTITKTTTNVGTATADWVHCSKDDGPDRVAETFNDGGPKCDTKAVTPATDEATVTVPVANPRIYLQKLASVDELPAGGGEVTYTYKVSNIGNVPLSGVTLVDNKCEAVSAPTGDTDADSILDLTETWTYTCTMTLTATTTNLATATGHYGDDTTIDAAEKAVFVANPRIYLKKSASVDELPAGGGAVTYTYAVWNIGNVPLSGVTLVDNKCSPIGAPTGDTNADSKLDLTETWTYTCTMTLTETTTNLATATGHYGDDTTIDAAEKEVTVTSRLNHPQIYLLKTASVTELPAQGGPVTFTYLVWNTGNAPLTDVTVVDDKCSAVTGPTGDTGADGILGLEEVWTYTCTMTLTATTTNTGTATGHAGDYESVDAAQATVTVLGGGGVAGETDVPNTAPPTDTIVPATTGTGGSIPLLLLILGIIGAGAVVLTPTRVKR